MQIYKLQRHTVAYTTPSYKRNNLVRTRYCICLCKKVDTNYNKQYINLIKDIRLIIDSTKIARSCNCKMCRNVCMKSWDELDEIVTQHEIMLQHQSCVTLTQKEKDIQNTDAWDVIT